jgi:N-acetylneuraminate synthase
MCGGSTENKRIPSEKEIKYLDELVRGVYALRDLPVGYTLDHSCIDDDVYLAIPLQKGQLSCRELMSGEVLAREVKANSPIMIDDIDSLYARDEELRKTIYNRGIES